MKNTRKFIRMFLPFILIFALLTGCGGNANTGTEAPGVGDTNAIGVGETSATGVEDTDGGEQLRIVTTIFPEYDWVRQILGDATDYNLTLLLSNGVDLHNYQPTVDDMIKIANCDLFIYIGGASDEWAEDALKTAVNHDMEIINLLEILGDAVKEEEIVEGMQSEENKDDGDEIEYDEHIWLSLKNAAVCCDYIAETLGKIDPSNADIYAANSENYINKLNALDAQYADAVNAAPVKTLLFGDRFPFRYLTDDYGLDYYAAFVGCSAETEASFETVIFLANKTDELNLSSVLTIENSDGKIARTIIENTAAKSARILQMDSMQSVTARDIENGATYLDAMANNLAILIEATRA